MEAVGPKHAGQIWGFISKFVMLDHFSQALGVVDIHPGLPVLRKTCTPHYLGTGAKVTCFTGSTVRDKTVQMFVKVDLFLK